MRQNSSGGKDRLGRISKMGDRYLRKLLVVGATSVVRRARTADTTAANWVLSLLERKPARHVTVTMANKNARIVWAVLARVRPIARLLPFEEIAAAYMRRRVNCEGAALI